MFNLFSEKDSPVLFLFCLRFLFKRFSSHTTGSNIKYQSFMNSYSYCPRNSVISPSLSCFFIDFCVLLDTIH